MTGTVLAGGKSSRMGRPKAFIEVGGRKIIESTIDTLRACLGRVVLSANEPQGYLHLGVPIIEDICKDAGPMGGILSVLLSGESEVFVAACDMPFIKPELVKYIAGHKGLDATVPVFNGKPEPLLAVYTKGAIGYMGRAIKNKRTSLRDMLGNLNILYIEEADVRKIDPEGRSFLNINTLEDFDLISNESKGGRLCLV